MTEPTKEDIRALRAQSAVLSGCEGRMLADGSGPHIAEPAVWAELDRWREMGEADLAQAHRTVAERAEAAEAQVERYRKALERIERREHRGQQWSEIAREALAPVAEREEG